MTPVLSSFVGRNNSDLIAHIAPLWLPPEALVVDVTYGRGKFWDVYKPPRFIAHDLYTLDGVDFRDLPEEKDAVDVIVMDPSYVSPGGRTTSGAKFADMAERYAMHGTAKDPVAQWRIIADGIEHCASKLAPDGVLLLKAMNYVWSGKVQWCVRWAFAWLEEVGLTVEDEIIHVGGTGPQPKTNRDGTPRRQVHARRNHSTLIVARKPRRRRTR